MCGGFRTQIVVSTGRSFRLTLENRAAGGEKLSQKQCCGFDYFTIPTISTENGIEKLDKDHWRLKRPGLV